MDLVRNSPPQRPFGRTSAGAISNGVEIRQATAADFGSIAQLIAQYPETLLQEHLPEPETFFVALENDTIVGCCALEIYSKRLAEVRSLAVQKGFQSKGIGTALIERCLMAAKERGVYEVLTITGANSLFEKHGFGTFKNEKFALIKVLGSSSNT